MNLDTNDVHLWYITFNNKKLLNINKLFQILNENEKIKSKSFIQHRDQRNYIISHAYLRLLLTKYQPNIKPESWIFSKNKYGKPFVSKEHDINIYFNISHTYSAVTFIFTKSNICGIDIEEDRNIVLDEHMINFVLSSEEKNLYKISKNKKSLFYRFWTLKEAYLKACGIGISPNIKQTNYSTIKNINLDSFIIFKQKNYYYGTFFINSKPNTKIYLSYCIKSLQQHKILFWNDPQNI